MSRRVVELVVSLAVLAFGCAGVSGASPTTSASIGPPATHSAPSSPTIVPSQAPETPPDATSPRATSTPEVASWSGLRWSAGVPGSSDATGHAYIADFVRWHDGYVGVGDFERLTGTADGAFFASRDGLRWTITKRIALASTQESTGPRFLVPVGDDVLAVSDNDGFAPPNLWRSTDGKAWTAVSSPSWRKAWTGGNLLAIAGGPAGLVAIGSQGLSMVEPGAPVVVSSRDGSTWSRLNLPVAFDHAIFGAVLADDRGFIITGRIGKPDATPAHGGALGVGRPAAWISTDGLTWSAAKVDGMVVAGGQLDAAFAGATGLFAEGRADGARVSSGWVSSDGASWRLAGKLGSDLPEATTVAGDGSHLVMFGRASCTSTTLLAYGSTDGASWSRLAFSGSTGLPDAVGGPICQSDGTEAWNADAMVVSAALVGPDGVLVAGTGNLPQEFWLATATGQ